MYKCIVKDIHYDNCNLNSPYTHNYTFHTHISSLCHPVLVHLYMYLSQVSLLTFLTHIIRDCSMYSVSDNSYWNIYIYLIYFISLFGSESKYLIINFCTSATYNNAICNNLIFISKNALKINWSLMLSKNTTFHFAITKCNKDASSQSSKLHSL